MRRTFLLWLLAVICTTFLATGALVYARFTQHARERAEQMMAARVSDMLELFLHYERSTSFLSRMNVASTMDRARALADIINLRPRLLNKQEELQGICNRLGAERIAVSDENGTVVAAVPASEVGTNLAQHENTAQFLECVAAPGYELSVRDTTGSAEEQRLQHAAVHRLDAPGVVILTFRMQTEQEAHETASVSRLAENLKLGERGRIFVFRRGAAVVGEAPANTLSQLLAMPANRVQEHMLEDEEYYTYAVDREGYRLVGAVPTEQVYRASLGSIKFLLLSNLILFVVMFAVVSYLLQRLVVRSIYHVNDALREITEGNLARRVDVMNSPEFARLSNGVNFMVESLHALGEEKRQSLNRDLELARTIQSTVMPNRFPAFPNIPAFDLHAACLPAQIVGGDFYDFFLTDDRHLSFLVADIDASGVPAALFMMRAISIIRMRGKSGEPPMQLLRGLNDDLCRSNAGIRMALFYGSLDIETGVLDYANAGGMHALVQHVEGEYEMLPGAAGAHLGERKGTEFYTAATKLQPEDRLFLYTGGLVLAANASNTPFGEARLQEALRSDSPTVEDTIAQVRASLRHHCGSAELQKDVTMLCLEYRGELANVLSMNLPAADTAAANSFLTERLESLFVAPPDIHDMQKSLTLLLLQLPTEQYVGLHIDCTEQLGRVTLAWQGDELNPLLRTGPLPVDLAQHTYARAEEVNRVTIQKNFG